MKKVRSILLATALTATVATALIVSPSNIDPGHKFSWGENIGWMNWRDAEGAKQGVDVGSDFLSGYIWGENVGWINAGDGAGPYGNNDDTDFGVNILGNDDLDGFAWGENIGWINFGWAANTGNTDRARFDGTASRFRGWAWGENIGWINLDDDSRFVGKVCPESTTPEPDRLELAGNPISTKGRVLSFTAGDPGRTQLIRVRAQQLPGAHSVWDCTTGSCETWWVGTPRRICEAGNTADVPSPGSPPGYGCPSAPGLVKARRWNWFAPLVCDKEGLAEARDWHGVCTGGACVGGLNPGEACTVDDDCQDVINVYHEAIIPSRRRAMPPGILTPATYEIAVIESTCAAQDSESNYSPPLMMTQAVFGDLVLNNSTSNCPRPAPNFVIDSGDILAMLDKFSAANCAVKKSRADVAPAMLDFKVDAGDIVQVLNAFGAANYPLVPINAGDPCGLGILR